MKGHPVFLESIFAFDKGKLLFDDSSGRKILEEFFEKNVAGGSAVVVGLLFGLFEKDAKETRRHIDFNFLRNLIE